MNSEININTKFIVLSGIDGSGKSTQLDLIKDYYIKNGKSVINLWTRGGSTPGINALKSFIRKFAGKRLPPAGHSEKRDRMFATSWVQNVWITLSILDLLRIYSISVRWWSLTRRVVICDRYLWDTYIDFTIMFPNINIDDWFLWKLLVKCSPAPQKSALLMISMELSEERCSNKFDPFPDTPEIRKIRYQLYKAASNKKHWDVINASESIDSVFRNIMNKDID